MPSRPHAGVSVPDHDALLEHFERVRRQSVALCETLAPEDMVVQSMPEVSPTKWHLAHVTWFFERFILKTYLDGYQELDPRYDFLFNSYYYTAGEMHARPRRGLLSRPTVTEVLDYRRHVDAHVVRLIENADDECGFLLTLGLNHEQQHQELMLTDIKHVLAQNPLRPAYRVRPVRDPGACAGPLDWQACAGGIAEIGAEGEGFCFDNETPRHRVWLEPFELATRPVTNREFVAFIRDDGYERAELWLSDGWATVRAENWDRPLYWNEDRGSTFTLNGEQGLDPEAPVTHVSYYEADAYARWAGARLPTEAEWEVAAASIDDPHEGNFSDTGHLQPAASDAEGMRQMFGDVWEWTASPYAPYPGFQPLAGSLGEYNGKFMCSQLVLRGGSCATPANHIRPTYRNFFYPRDRWQFTGIRLARSV